MLDRSAFSSPHTPRSSVDVPALRSARRGAGVFFFLVFGLCVLRWCFHLGVNFWRNFDVLCLLYRVIDHTTCVYVTLLQYTFSPECGNGLSMSWREYPVIEEVRFLRACLFRAHITRFLVTVTRVYSSMSRCDGTNLAERVTTVLSFFLCVRQRNRKPYSSARNYYS